MHICDDLIGVVLQPALLFANLLVGYNLLVNQCAVEQKQWEFGGSCWLV